jgi:hypothetical protein
MKYLRTISALGLAILATLASPVYAQQTGAISGKVVGPDGLGMPGVTVQAESSVLPTPRVTTTSATGEFRMPALVPGEYTVTFTLSGMQTVTRKAGVTLDQDIRVDAKLDVKGVTETVSVTADVALTEKNSATLKNSISQDQIKNLPVGQEYRDLIKLLPAVQYTQDTTRGPSAGGNGQDNVYQFDGANVTLPLFGTLSAEPAAHDIAQVTVIRGGAKAVDFDRSGGFLVDSVSKSGTSRFSGMASYQFQTDDMAWDLKKSSGLSRYQKNQQWWDFNLGGPIVKNKAFFYGSYYHPIQDRANQANVYGTLPDYNSDRNEVFGKVTFTPKSNVLFNVSYRNSHRLDTGDVFPSTSASTTGSGSEAWLKIGTADGSWVINARSFATVKYSHFVNQTQGRPDNVADVTISTTPGTKLDIANLDRMGLFAVPAILTGQTAFNTFIQPIVDKYGYVDPVTNLKTGGGTVGYASLFDKDDFFRDSLQFGYNLVLGSAVQHDIHAGYQWYVDSEDLERRSNGWGSVTVPGGRTSFQGQQIFYQAAFQQQTTGGVPVIHSEYRSQSIELNDTIRWRTLSANVGFLLSNDTLFGQGLRNDASQISGYTFAAGNKYKMYEIPFSKMVQPRIAGSWAPTLKDTIYGSFAVYKPSASSLPRAASWDRNLAVTINAYFDANGTLFGTDPNISSTGKLFVDDLTPRSIDEYLIGGGHELSPRLAMRAYWRHRKGSHFWEDTNNNARVAFAPPAGIPQTLYIPDLAQKLTQIGTGGNGNSYVIAELDGSYTKYYEATVESEYHGGKLFVRGSYTWSHYYGNFDQDNTTIVNDANAFIGSSNIGDGAGRQLWNFRDGTLRGDRPHNLKIYGFYTLPWRANAGAFFTAQSGQPWETRSYRPYVALTSSTTDSSRYAETAGIHRTDGHAQVDLNYTQNIPLAHRLNAQVVLDVYNIGNSQTGYNIEDRINNAAGTYGTARNFYDPRRVQLAFRLTF